MSRASDCEKPSFQRSYYERYMWRDGDRYPQSNSSPLMLRFDCCPGSGRSAEIHGDPFSFIRSCICVSCVTPLRHQSETATRHSTHDPVGDPSLAPIGPKRPAHTLWDVHVAHTRHTTNYKLKRHGVFTSGCLMYRSLTLAHSCPTLALALSSRDCGCTVPWHVCVVYSCTAVHS